MSDLYIGLMSGTSADGIDAVLVDFESASPRVVAEYYAPYPAELQEKILSLCQAGENEIERLGEMDILLGKAFATAVHTLLKNAAIPKGTIKAIGSHGQTIRHQPRHATPFTLQIGDPNIIAVESGITTIADFRRKDIALGGQGAPLVPAFHHALFGRSDLPRAIVNIGGMANVTVLSGKQQVMGFDVGPGNVLLDDWIRRHLKQNRDEKGSWGAQGIVQPSLLNRLLADPFFHLPPPKSTGREHFHLTWLDAHLSEEAFSAVDVQATLTELTATVILQALHPHLSAGEILVCGGGVHNDFLMSRLRKLASRDITVTSTQKYGIDPDWIEAVAFAWLARQTLNLKSGNLPLVTGSRQAAILGGIYYP